MALTRDISCDVIVTHFNYSEYVETALRSVLEQSHDAFDCIVVDDASADHHYERLLEIIAKLADPRLRVLRLEKNVGQILAIDAALKQSRSEFVSFLDPDDTYETEFLATMLRAHLNGVMLAAVATCDMGVFRIGNGPLTSHYIRSLGNTDPALRAERAARREKDGYSDYFPPWRVGWLWATTSSLMLRRDAMQLIAPRNFVPTTKAFGDTYWVQGAHMIGGTLYVDEALSWRGIHGRNTAESNLVFSHDQKRHNSDFDLISKEIGKKLKWASFCSFLQNDGWKHFTPANFGEVVTAHFKGDELYALAKQDKNLADMLLKYACNVSEYE
jgi:glycosyltransferase involved in cell wall biosynthesis